ncbi:uncharacterized protein [Gossypium hirsutum]|uniref:Retrovirus-related Pol polyprotein from transposon TNT 1-94-like beta-barrel domain-containing protein n=1 Tax=Gossypium hirsutum TaxID=3635 RepID=A0A1U8NM60_GOSHI|nr:uncharacterized protein LOC107949846 [Gossypium hirsutum]
MKMREEETVKRYADRIMAVVNSIGLLSEQFSEEQMRASKVKEHQEGAFQAKAREASSTNSYKGKKVWKNRPKPDVARREDQPCDIAKGLVIKKKNAGLDQMHYVNIKNVEAHVAENSSDHEEQVFTVSCSANQKKGSKGWLLDSGCINHMSPDATIFKNLDRNCKTKVNVGNGQFIKAEGKGDVLICTPTSAKVISNVLLVRLTETFSALLNYLRKVIQLHSRAKSVRLLIRVDQAS